LTTHTGSLPRPDDFIRTMFAKEEGVPVDRAALAARISKAVAEVLKKQVESGVDLVKGQFHPGEHTPIVDQPLWHAVREQLAGNPGGDRRCDARPPPRCISCASGYCSTFSVPGPSRPRARPQYAGIRSPGRAENRSR
jgi:hypothetical protein